MTVNIQLMVNAGSGVLASVVTQLQASGVRVKSHKLESVNGTSSLLTMSAENANGLDREALKSSLSSINVVQSVEQIEMSMSPGRAPAAAEPAIDVPEDVVDRIVSSFPKIMPHIQNYEERIVRDPRREEKIRALGAATGKRFAADLGPGSFESKAGIIDQLVMPKINQIAEASRNDESVVVRISLFTRRHVTSMDLVGGENENCYFLCGLIEGMTSSVPSFEGVSVEEKRCRANGDDNCVFALS